MSAGIIPAGMGRTFNYLVVCHRQTSPIFHYIIKRLFFAEQRLLLLGKRIFIHPSIFTFNHVMNASGTKSLNLSKLIQIIVKNVEG